MTAQRPLTAPEKMVLTQALADKSGRPVDLLDPVTEPLLGSDT